MLKKSLFLFVALVCSFRLFAQAKKDSINLKKTITIDHKIFKVYNNWLSCGAGEAYNTTLRKPQFAGGVDFNFHIQQYYFQSGFFLSGNYYGFYNNYQFHLCYGKRSEDRITNFAWFAGLSYSKAYRLVDSIYTNPVKVPGLYGDVELIRKITYDVGIGASVFADINQQQAITGIKLVLFFSGSYKGMDNDD